MSQSLIQMHTHHHAHTASILYLFLIHKVARIGYNKPELHESHSKKRAKMKSDTQCKLLGIMWDEDSQRTLRFCCFVRETVPVDPVVVMHVHEYGHRLAK